jgi:cyclase
MRASWITAVALALFAFALPARAITADHAEFTKIADGVYAYVGRLNDANCMVVVTAEGVVVVDTGNNTTDTRALLADIKSVTAQPVRYVVITQNHGDHAGGTPFFSPPATVILQERAAANWAAMKPYQIASWRKRFPERAAALKNVNPVDTVLAFRDHMTLHLGGRDIELIYVDDTYNPGDVAVWLPKEGVLHASFAGYKDRHPDIRPDYSHGTTEGMLKQLRAYIALKPKIVVPAHGPLGDAKILDVMVDYLDLARKKVGDMMAKGMALPAIEKAFAMDEFKGWDRTQHLPWTADTIYRELKHEGPVVVHTEEKNLTGLIVKTAEDGRFLTVDTGGAEPVHLRVDEETDLEGVDNRTGLKDGMKVTALYAVPEGMSAALGYDALELTIGK